MVLMNVDLPHPEGPMSANTLFLTTDTDTPFKAKKSP
jgi:hypothetical protein